MSILHVQTSGLVLVEVAGTQIVTMPGNFTAGSTGVLLLSAFPANSVGPVLINGVTATKRQSVADGGSGATSAEIWVAENLPGGGNTASITTAAGTTFSSLSVEEFSGLNVASYDTGTVNSGTGTGSTAASVTSPTLSLADEVVLTVVSTDSGQSPVITVGPSAPWNQVFLENDGGSHQAGQGLYQVVSSTSPVTVNWTLNIGNGGSGWSAAILSLKAPGSPSPPSSGSNGGRLSSGTRLGPGSLLSC